VGCLTSVCYRFAVSVLHVLKGRGAKDNGKNLWVVCTWDVHINVICWRRYL